MSLADRYNRGDGRLQSLDRYLTQLGDRAGRVWWSRTGISRVTLTQGLYVFSAWAATQQFTLTHDPIMITLIVAAVINWQSQFTGRSLSRGGLVEQIQSEAAGLPKNTLVVLRLIILFLGGFQLALAAGDVLSTLLGASLISVMTLQTALVGGSLFALQASDYIRRTNPMTPSSGGHRRSV